MSMNIPASHESTLPIAVAPAAEQMREAAASVSRVAIEVGRSAVSLVRTGLESIADATYPEVSDARRMYLESNETDIDPNPVMLEAQLYGMQKTWWSDVRKGAKTLSDTAKDRILTEVPPRPVFDDALYALRNDMYATDADADHLNQESRATWKARYGSLRTARLLSAIKRTGR